jgi:phage terminase large subunit
MSKEYEKVSFKELANFTPKQAEAFKLMRQLKYLLYGGAMGGGKSRWLRWTLLFRLLEFWARGLKRVRSGLFCEDYPALEDRQISKVAFEFPEWLGILNKTDHEFVLHPQYGSGVLCFRNLDNPSKYQSAEFADEGVDELTKNPREVFDFLRTRLRWPGIDDNKFIAATNPGDIGHAWVKSLFLDRFFDENEQEADQFGFIQATAADNPYLSSSYLRTLDSLPEDMRKAYRDGDWNIFKGQFFSEWREGRHGLASYLPTSADDIYGSMDWGFDPDAFCYHLHAVSRIHTPEADFQRIITFAELYGNRKYPKEWATDIKLLEKDYTVSARYADPSAGNKHPLWTAKEAGGDSVLAEFSNHGINFVRANNDKKNGYQAMRNWMAVAPDGEPYWQITAICQNLRQQIPAAIFDPYNSFIVKEGGEDHALMSSRYFLISRPVNSIVPKQEVKPNSYEYFKQLRPFKARQPIGV